jgi:hypothetical protein
VIGRDNKGLTDVEGNPTAGGWYSPPALWVGRIRAPPLARPAMLSTHATSASTTFECLRYPTYISYLFPPVVSLATLVSCCDMLDTVLPRVPLSALMLSIIVIGKLVGTENVVLEKHPYITGFIKRLSHNHLKVS